MTLEESLRDILKKPVEEWTNTDRVIIAKSNTQMGRARVKSIRDEVSQNQ